MSKNWLVVASADHVAMGSRGGFVQAYHGKPAPMRRLQPGDRVVCYSPSQRYSPSHASRSRDRLQAFTAIGTVRDGDSYRADPGGTDGGAGFQPWRRDVAWHDAEPVAISALRAALSFMHEKNWGYRLRQGLVEISDADMVAIAEAMFTAAAEPYRLAA
jgi:EVE domain